MNKNTPFPPLTNFEPTRETLHWYAKAVGVLPRVHVKPHPKWWHISFKVKPDGLYLKPMALPGGGSLQVKMDLVLHKMLLLADGQQTAEFDMTEGLTATAFGDRILGVAAELGLSGEYQRHRFENEEPRLYNPRTVPAFWRALSSADRIFKDFRSTIDGERSPTNFWTHGFDLSFEWYGTRMVTFEERGKITEYPAQINLGFYPGDPAGPPYFYSNPWPFEAERYLDRALPEGVSWHTEGWKGTIFPYSALAGATDAEERLLEYARTVHRLAAPPLTAGDGTPVESAS